MKFLPLLSLVLLFTFTACQAQESNQNVEASADALTTKIELIDFYGTHRCVTCKAIEKSAAYTIATYFQNEVDAGRIEFKTVNVDAEENYAMAERFEASGTALYLNVITDGKEEHIDLTNFAFSKGRDQEVFAVELKEKIDAILNTF